MHCTSKWCGFVQALAQLVVASAVVWAALVVNEHMTTWSNAFSQGADDLHQIRISMEKMDDSVNDMSTEMKHINVKMDHVIHNMYGMKKRLSPRSWMPF